MQSLEVFQRCGDAKRPWMVFNLRIRKCGVKIILIVQKVNDIIMCFKNQFHMNTKGDFYEPAMLIHVTSLESYLWVCRWKHASLPDICSPLLISAGALHTQTANSSIRSPAQVNNIVNDVAKNREPFVEPF